MNSDEKSMDFFHYLKERLKKPLPCIEAHIEMAPMIEGKPYRVFDPPKNVKASSVLILFCKNKLTDKLEVIFTLRNKKLLHHGGQISFPGGMAKRNESTVDTALREAEEEIGIKKNEVKIIGKLSQLYVEPSNALITPIVGYIEELPELKANAKEVAEIFHVPFHKFLEADIFFKEKWLFGEKEVTVPLWKVHPTTPLWGATSMILKELLMVCEETNILIIRRIDSSLRSE